MLGYPQVDLWMDGLPMNSDVVLLPRRQWHRQPLARHHHGRLCCREPSLGHFRQARKETICPLRYHRAARVRFPRHEGRVRELGREQEDGVRARAVRTRAEELPARGQRLGPEGRLQSSRRSEGLNKNISAYGMCFNIIVEYIRNAEQVATLAHHGVSFRVEKGNKNNVDVGQRFEYFAGHEQLVDIIKTMKFVDKEHSAAIQLADFLAFYSRRHAEKCERDRNAKAAHDEPLATMLRLFEPHRGVLANDFFGKRPGHEELPGVS